jgi:hypothetical protein
MGQTFSHYHYLARIWIIVWAPQENCTLNHKLDKVVCTLENWLLQLSKGEPWPRMHIQQSYEWYKGPWWELKAGDGQREGHRFQNLGITYDVIQNKLEDSIQIKKTVSKWHVGKKRFEKESKAPACCRCWNSWWGGDAMEGAVVNILAATYVVSKGEGWGICIEWSRRGGGSACAADMCRASTSEWRSRATTPGAVHLPERGGSEGAGGERETSEWIPVRFPQGMEVGKRIYLCWDRIW